ncbi:PREDICTED: organic cation transporter protein-like [Dufourea novaeangliae]|uniref:organic cation transporter protein-like n=1 Tax=Dufourea novaeangliae TaxID=178035 RepID=UPI0007671499|nr:PREDICTED: organic cation transporter protein-like [Dufourea novaeangliae]
MGKPISVLQTIQTTCKCTTVNLRLFLNTQHQSDPLRISFKKQEQIEFPMRPSQFFLPDDEDGVTLDDILIFLGEFGTYQRYLFGSLTIFCMFLSFVYFTQAFLTVLPKEYWCRLPLVDGVSEERLRDIMIPSSKLVPNEGHHLPYSRCWIYDLPVEEVLAVDEPNESWPLKRCTEWNFKISRDDVPYMSVAAEQNWVCDEAYKTHLAQSIFFVGSIVGGFLFGWVADKYGRIPVLVATNMIGFVGGLSTVYINYFWQFCACRFVVGLAYDNTFVMAYILVLEYVGPKWRTFTANISYGIFFTLGTMSLPWLSYNIANWRTFAVVTCLPLVIALAAPHFIPESVRWLISQGQVEKGIRIIAKIEKVNRMTIPSDIYQMFVDDCARTADILAAEDHSILDLLRTKRLRRITILLTLSWGIIQMSYDGHIRCLDDLGMNIFTTFTIASATEFPAVLLVTYILDVLGRRWTLFSAVILSGLTTFVICGRFFINIASNIAMQYAAELLPTVVRGKGVAVIHVMGYVTSIISPFIAFSNRILHNLPMIILGISCICAGILCLFLPETLMEQLPQNLTDGELFGINQSFWDTPFTRKKPPEPRGHHMHARRPASRPALLRSSMISGSLGDSRRISVIQSKMSLARIGQSWSQPAESAKTSQGTSQASGTSLVTE